MIVSSVQKKKIVYRHRKGKIRHMITQNAWACQCIKDCDCNSDWTENNQDNLNRKEFYRIDARGENPKPNRFKTLEEAKKILFKL